MMKAETLLRGLIELAPITQGLLQQGERADDVGLDELRRTVDRAVDMTFGSEIHHAMRLVRIEQAAQRWPVADVHLSKAIARVAGGARN